MQLTPTSQLFPYTTLFRSRRGPGEPVPGRPPRHSHAAQRGEPDRALRRGTWPRLAARDRKCTRLNSSHVETSYAVFGLKKKTSVPKLPLVGRSASRGGASA